MFIKPKGTSYLYRFWVRFCALVLALVSIFKRERERERDLLTNKINGTKSILLLCKKSVDGLCGMSEGREASTGQNIIIVEHFHRCLG